MSDAFEQIFGFSSEYYPGSKRKRRDPAEVKTTKVSTEGWDSRPYVKTIRGRQIEMFTTGALALALGRKVVTVRLWTRKGYIPQAPFRLPPKIVNGKEQKGRRLYTREMIESAVESFQRHGVFHKDRVEWKHHEELSIEIFETWRELHQNL